MSSTKSVFARHHLWRGSLLILISLAVVAGICALRAQFVMYFPGDISPDGCRLIAYKYIQTSQFLRIWTFVADAKTGQVQHDLSHHSSTQLRWRWAPDGKSVVGIVETNDLAQSKVVQVEVNERSQILRERTFVDKDIEYVNVHEDDSLVFVERHAGNLSGTDKARKVASRPYLRVFTADDVELARFEYGMDEHAFVSAYRDDRSMVGVAFFPSREPTAGDDFVATDGTNWRLLQFDSRTGERLNTITLTPQDDARGFALSQYATTSIRAHRHWSTFKT